MGGGATSCMGGWLRDGRKGRHIDVCLKIYDALLPKQSKLDSREPPMKALLVTWLAEWDACPLTTTHVLSSWNMVFTEVPLTESEDDVDLPRPSAPIRMPAPLLSVPLGFVLHAEEASKAETDEASEVDENIDVLSVPGTPPVPKAAKKRAKNKLNAFAKSFHAA